MSVFFAIFTVAAAPLLCYGQGPSAPASVTFKNSTSTSLTLEWSLVGGADVIGYKVTYTPSNGSCEGSKSGIVEIMDSDQTNITLLSLDENTLYDILVYSGSDLGYGNSSELVSFRTKPSVPVSPIITSVLSYPPYTSNSHYMVEISWLPFNCSDINDDELKSYNLFFKIEGSNNLADGIVHIFATAKSAMITNAQFRPWKLYHFQMAAYNSVGGSNLSDVHSTVLLGVPGSVHNLTVALGTGPAGSVRVHWNPPSDINTRVFLSHYEVTFESGESLFTAETRNNEAEAELPLSDVPYRVGVATVVGHLKGETVFAHMLIPLTPPVIPSTPNPTTATIMHSSQGTSDILTTLLLPESKATTPLETILGVTASIILSILVLICITIIAVCVYRNKFINTSKDKINVERL